MLTDAQELGIVVGEGISLFPISTAKDGKARASLRMLVQVHV